jgi:hypothetical protein
MSAARSPGRGRTSRRPAPSARWPATCRRDDGSPWFRTEDNDPLIAVAQDLLETGQRAGELGDFDAWTLAVMLRGTIDGLAERFMADPSLDGPTVTDNLVRLVDRMIRPSEDR